MISLKKMSPIFKSLLMCCSVVTLFNSCADKKTDFPITTVTDTRWKIESLSCENGSPILLSTTQNSPKVITFKSFFSEILEDFKTFSEYRKVVKITDVINKLADIDSSYQKSVDFLENDLNSDKHMKNYVQVISNLPLSFDLDLSFKVSRGNGTVMFRAPDLFSYALETFKIQLPGNIKVDSTKINFIDKNDVLSFNYALSGDSLAIFVLQNDNEVIEHEQNEEFRLEHIFEKSNLSQICVGSKIKLNFKKI